MAYVTYPEGNLWRSKADGNERFHFMFPRMQVLFARRSPDQKQIVFTGFVPVNQAAIICFQPTW